MDYEPLVTVVISVYNKELYITQAIESVINQTYRNLDIIVVDDGSTDSSLEIIKQYNGSDSRLRFYTQPNQGVASCRNRGLSDSAGEFIIFLDGDDYLYSEYIATVVGYMEVLPYVDLLHVAWDNVDESGKCISSISAVDYPDYLHTLLLGNIFAIHAVFCRVSFLKKVGLFKFYTVTDDWEYWIRCASNGGQFKALSLKLAATRRYSDNNKRIKSKQQQRFFPIIAEVFEPGYGLPEKYRQLETASRLRHHFFLLDNYIEWGWRQEAREQFEKALGILKNHSVDLTQYSFILPHMNISQLTRLSYTLVRHEQYRQAIGLWLTYMSIKARLCAIYRLTGRIAKGQRLIVIRSLGRLESGMEHSLSLSSSLRKTPYTFDSSTTINDIQLLTLSYINKQRIMHSNKFAGYRHSASSTKPVLYATLAALLIKHLYGVHDEMTKTELDYVLSFQCEDGIFRDPVIDCPQAYGMYHGWGWRHLTLHSYMTLALYGTPAYKAIPLVEPYNQPDHFRKFLESRSWIGQAAATGNELQNIGVMLQYARDYQASSLAGSLMEVMYEVIDSKQNPQTGLYGDAFRTPNELSLGVMSAYHLWLLYFYDGRPIHHLERIIDTLLRTQNIIGGYGTRWNSSACEDIDSIDPLARLLKLTNYRRDEVQVSMQRALPHLLRNLNSDGDWVFRRHEPNKVIHPQMSSATDEGDMVYTWFRTLALAYLLTALDCVPTQMAFSWKFKHAPGHQF